ncbi:hypothetical protein D1AOALGA4SA_9062 [Olavius algarvensis Delta 1 endosymbiont]|nr:hypothetical protein D1AOALGA4SA_9062 [Olavius algarvensis Delta 1 endosymbiont]
MTNDELRNPFDSNFRYSGYLQISSRSNAGAAGSRDIE